MAFSELPVTLILILAVASFIRAFHVGRVSTSRTFKNSLLAHSVITSEGSLFEGTALQREAVTKFVRNGKAAKFLPTSGGVSNDMAYVYLPGATSVIAAPGEPNFFERKYILRVYNNGKKSDLVKFEHDILSQLPRDMPFKVPVALPSLTESGRTHELLSSGDEACVFEIIPGELPKLTCVEQIGEASGLISTLMGQLQNVGNPPDYVPYYELFKVHHAIDRVKFYEQIESSAFDAAREDIDRLTQHVRDMEQQIEVFHGKGLEMQLIHGDLHYDNVLVDDGKVSGLLDFEYCGVDWRAMELAICLSKYAGEPEPMQYFEPFIKGFARTAKLSTEEMEMIADLIVLRILSNVVFFVGRTLTKEDTADSLNSRAAVYNSRIEWIQKNRDSISGLIKSFM